MKDLKGLQDFNVNVKDKRGFVIVDFWAPWCAPCNAMTPILVTLSTSRLNVTFFKVNVDEAENTDLVSDFQILGIPLIVMFKDGHEIDRRTGAFRTVKQMEEWVDDIIAKSNK